MKRLTLLRHGNAEARAEGGDFERALDARGRAEAARAAQAMLQACGKPDLILASAAKRTRQTAVIFQAEFATMAVPVTAAPALAEATNGPTSANILIRTERSLYHAAWDQLLASARSAGDEIEHLLIVGHNPGISELALRWSNSLQSPPPFAGFSTAGWCSVTFDEERWADIATPVEGRFVATPLSPDPRVHAQ